MEDEDAWPTLFEGGFAGASRKRTHQAMLDEDRRLDRLQRRSTSIPRYPHAPSASLNRNFPPPPLFRRFAGDGYDFRRPAMPPPQPLSEDVIDLTAEDSDPQLPRPNPRPRISFTPGPGQEVIDLEDEDGDESEGTGDNIFDLRGSDNDLFENIASVPDVELLYSRPRSAAPNAVGGYAQIARSANNDPPTRGHQRRNAFAPAHAAGGEGPPGRTNSGSLLTTFLNEMMPRRLANYFPPHDALHTALEYGMGLRRENEHNRQMQAFDQPALDFEAVAFDLGRHEQPAAQPQRPTYQAPPPPDEGFTRTPGEGDVVVCPNCDCELGQGDDEVKREIWIIRSCGHVYCGQCAKHRTKKKNVNRTTKPFSTCVVEGCGKTKLTGPKAMLHLYIST